MSNGCGTLAADPDGAGPLTSTCQIGVRFAPVGTAFNRTGVSYTVTMTTGIEPSMSRSIGTRSRPRVPGICSSSSTTP